MLALLAAVAFAWAFDWNWCLPLLKRYLEANSGRRFECASLQVRFDHSFDPTITLRGLKIQNAPWAASREPFITAGRVSATIAWRSLWSDRTIVELIVLEDAQVDMERQADGLRNWRLRHPDDRGPPRVRVLALDARNSRLHTIHRGIGLELDARTEPLPAPQALPAHPELPLTRTLQFKGTLAGRAFDGDAAVSDVLVFGGTPQRFALRGTGRMGGLRVEAAGLSNDAHALGDLEGDFKVTADRPGPIWPLPPVLENVHPLAARGHVARKDGTWSGSDVHVQVGRRTAFVADVVFTGGSKSDAPRPRVQARVRDAVVDLGDVALLRGTGPSTEPAARNGHPGDDHALGTGPLELERLRGFDADVDLHDARFVGAEQDMARTLRAHATLRAGVLELRDVDLGLAGGHVTGHLRADASRTPPEIALDLKARALRLDGLSPTLAGNASLVGAVDGRAVLHMRGATMRALAASADGSVDASLARGASVSSRLDARLGLDGGHWLRSLFDKGARVPVICGAVTLAVADGVATSRRFVFETADTALAGRATARLADETLDATLTPARKKAALLALDKAIHAEGPWRDIRISLKPPGQEAPPRCADLSEAQR